MDDRHLEWRCIVAESGLGQRRDEGDLIDDLVGHAPAGVAKHEGIAEAGTEEEASIVTRERHARMPILPTDEEARQTKVSQINLNLNVLLRQAKDVERALRRAPLPHLRA